MAIAVIGGCAAVAFTQGFASFDDAAAVSAPAATSTPTSAPAVDLDRVAPPVEPAPMITAPAAEAPATTILTIEDPPGASELRADLEQQRADLLALREVCHSEQAVVFASFQAFYLQTGAVPDDPDVLVERGWLEAHPEGWASRWAIVFDDGAYFIRPQQGSLCDG